MTYSYAEIGSTHSGPKKVTDNKAAKRDANASVKIRAVISKKQVAHNVLEEVIQWRKFERVKKIAQTLIDRISLEEVIFIFDLLLGMRVSPKALH